jgi:hypothetical protein
MSQMWRRVLRRRGGDSREGNVRALVETLPVPTPWTIDGLVDIVARQTGRRILLHPLYDLPPEISGISLPATDDENETSFIICYDATVPTWSQRLIILHELGHHLLGHAHHAGPETGSQKPSRGQEIPFAGGYRHGLARASFDDPREVDAEWFATLMANRIERLRRAENSPTLQGIRRGIEPRHRWTEQ